MRASASEIIIVFAIKFMISTFLFINYTLLLFSHPSLPNVIIQDLRYSNPAIDNYMYLSLKIFTFNVIYLMLLIHDTLKRYW